jgi:hypothetical protein
MCLPFDQVLGRLIGLATTKEGPLRRVLINGVVETRLLVPPYAAIVSFDRRARLLKVWAIVRYAS